MWPIRRRRAPSKERWGVCRRHRASLLRLGAGGGRRRRASSKDKYRLRGSRDDQVHRNSKQWAHA
eukprot:4987857-Alexandrium_andersonii.AAC.1